MINMKLSRYYERRDKSLRFPLKAPSVALKFPKNPHLLAFRKIKTCYTSLTKSFCNNNLFVGQLQFLWYNPFSSKNTGGQGMFHLNP